MAESAEVTRAAGRGLMRTSDVAAFLGVSRQRDQMVAMDGLQVPGTVASRRVPTGLAREPETS